MRQKKNEINESFIDINSHLLLGIFPITLKSKPGSGDTGHDFQVQSIQNLDTLVLTSK